MLSTPVYSSSFFFFFRKCCGFFVNFYFCDLKMLVRSCHSLVSFTESLKVYCKLLRFLKIEITRSMNNISVLLKGTLT